MKVVTIGVFDPMDMPCMRRLDTALETAALKNAVLEVRILSDKASKRLRDAPVKPYGDRQRDVGNYIESNELRPYFSLVSLLKAEHENDLPAMNDDDIFVVTEEL